MKKWLALVLSLCMLCASLAFAEGAAYTPGTYEASADGLMGPVTVTVTVSERIALDDENKVDQSLAQSR